MLKSIRAYIYFNSIKVRLEQGGEMGGTKKGKNFNSIKVRLEQTIADHSFEGKTVFQFHKGAIRT